VILFGAPIDSEAISRELIGMPLTIDFEPTVHRVCGARHITGNFLLRRNRSAVISLKFLAC